MKKTETESNTESMDNNILVGYVRRSNAGGAIKLSINTAAFGDCSTYMTSDGQAYVPLVISMGLAKGTLRRACSDHGHPTPRLKPRRSLEQFLLSEKYNAERLTKVNHEAIPLFPMLFF